MSTLTMPEPVTPTVDDARLAKTSSRRLAPFLNRNLLVRLADSEEAVEYRTDELIRAQRAEGSIEQIAHVQHVQAHKEERSHTVGVSTWSQ